MYNQVPKPTRCLVNNESSCNGKKFKSITTDINRQGHTKRCKDYQEIRVQEQVTTLELGSIPQAITVILENDLVDKCKAGDDIIVT